MANNLIRDPIRTMDALASVFIFALGGLAFVLAGLVTNSIFSPIVPNSVKADAYECGEEPVGTGWVQFDLRFYIVALFYLVFDVEVALIYPWATIFRQYPVESFALGAPFLMFVIVGYAYEWHTGSLDWVKHVK